MQHSQYKVQPFGHPEDTPIESSIKELEDFRDRSVTWQDIRNSIEDHIELLEQQLLEAETLPEVRGLQYSIKECRVFLDMPNRLIHELKTLSDEDE